MMMMNNSPQEIGFSSRAFSFFLLSFLVFIIYSNTFNASWQMDDRPNIVDNPGLRIDNLMPDSLWGTFFANQGKTHALFRPLPCLTFALNWYAGRDNPFGYHVVNLGLHIATAWALYLLMMRLLAVLKNSRDKTDSNGSVTSGNVALLAALLWAVNPIQTQAVTYIVQRMAIMETLFYVMGMTAFVQARIAGTSSGRWINGIWCFACFVCSLGSKENAVLLPASLALVEWIFFRRGSFTSIIRPKPVIAGILFLIVCLLVAHTTIGLPFHYILNGYKERPFTLMERVMTQPRIVLGYLSQIFWPVPERLSIAHDVTLSTSLFHPWTTLPAILLIMALVAGSLANVKRHPLISFALLFFFLNHVVESSILPLELVFEHRNYLPSLFLFLPVAAGFQTLMQRLPRYGISRAGVAGIIIAVIMAMGLWTHTRNSAWATSESLWRDAAIKAPGSVRPLVTLGIQLAWRDHPTTADYRHALALFNRSLTLSRCREKEHADILGNIASVYTFQNNYAKAIEIYRQAIAIDPAFYKNRSDLIKSLIVAGCFEEARKQTEYLITVRPDFPDYWNTLGFILLWQEKNNEALVCFQNAMKMGLAKDSLLLNICVALTRTGYLERGRWFLKQGLQNRFDDPIPVFVMLENRIRAGDTDSTKDYAGKLVNALPARAILQAMDSLPGNYRFAPVSIALIRPVLVEAMTSILKQAN